MIIVQPIVMIGLHGLSLAYISSRHPLLSTPLVLSVALFVSQTIFAEHSHNFSEQN